MELEGRKILVLGLARTGLAVARFLAGRGARVVGADACAEERMAQARDEFARLPAPAVCHFGAEDTAWLDGVDAVVPSPGVPRDNPLLAEAVRRGIEVLSEIELAARFSSTPWVAITGTNGKTTTTRLVAAMLEAAGLRVFAAGNIGTPLIEYVDERPVHKLGKISSDENTSDENTSDENTSDENTSDENTSDENTSDENMSDGNWDWGVVEVSSFQLEWVRDFRPHVAIHLNLSEDHLDRYDDLSSYGATKARIFAAQQPGDVAVLNRDDPWVWALRHRLDARVVSFGWSEAADGAFATADAVVWRDRGKEQRLPRKQLRLRGVHNVENVMAAACAARAVGVAGRHIRAAARRFPGLEHRLEFVRDLAGARWFNDSKGTNVGAVRKSLASFDAPIVLIAGGVDKGGSYRGLEPLVRERVRKLILLGASAPIMKEALGGLTDTLVAPDLEAAVRAARAAARAGDVVLLSPACSSFDMFENYAERGRRFRELVQAL